MSVVLMSLLLMATWGLVHSYRGVVMDGELYAFQAMARLNPALYTDIYLMGSSQDRFTFFSPVYALFIGWLGLWRASAFLFFVCTVSFIAASWSIARALWDEKRAWLCAATCIIVVCGYGAYGVFSYSETYLSARTMAETLVAIGLACRLHGYWKWGWSLVAAAMLVHPLMALPGVLLLACLTVRPWHAFFGVLAGLAATLVVAWVSLHLAESSGPLTVISEGWLEVVRERSQFLFLQMWRWSDWREQLRPFISLILATLVAEQLPVRRLCLSAILIGAAGLAVAFIASSVGPVAILLQGQAWRWCWITGFVAVLMLVPTALGLWKEKGCGMVSASLLVASWTFPPVDGLYLALGAIVLWLVRGFIRLESRPLLSALAYLLIVLFVSWVVANAWSTLTHPPVTSTGDPLLIERLRSVLALQIPALAVAWLGLWWFSLDSNIVSSCLGLAALVTLCLFALWGSFRQNPAIGTASSIDSVAEWRRVIPATSNVLVVPSSKAASFIWFTLQRPSYLTVDQAAGVVFSPDTAREVRRRSDVLLPVMEPSWRIMSQLAGEAANGKKNKEDALPLTAERLHSICRDPLLGFVIAKEQLDFERVPNTSAGPWKDWNLYNCGAVRASAD